jgi:DNA-binding beta-propeller fold protein YncE
MLRRRLHTVLAIGFGLAIAVLPSAALGGSASGDVNPPDHAVQFLTTMNFGPNTPSSSFDISWVDQSTGQYFLADSGHQAVAWFNATSDSFVGFLAQGMFSGSGSPPSSPAVDSNATCKTFATEHSSSFTACNGPNGVVTDDQGRVWAGNSPTSTSTLNDPSSNVVVIDPATRAVVKVIDTGGQARSDELSFDPVDHVVLIANPDDGFLTWISTTTLQVVGKFYYSGNADGVTPTVANHPAAGGLEQSVFDPRTGLFYQAVPGVGIDVFEPVPVNGVGQLVTTFPLPSCTGGPTGLVIGPNDTLIGACANGGAVVELHNGYLRTIIPNVGGADEMWFNPGDGNAYFAIIPTLTSSVLGVANAHNDHWLQNLDISGVPTSPLPLAHSVAAYAGNNQIFVPVVGQGVFVYQSAGH